MYLYSLMIATTSGIPIFESIPMIGVYLVYLFVYLYRLVFSSIGSTPMIGVYFVYFIYLFVYL